MLLFNQFDVAIFILTPWCRVQPYFVYWYLYSANNLRRALHILYIHLNPCPRGVYNLRSLPHMQTHTRTNLDRDQLTYQHLLGM